MKELRTYQEVHTVQFLEGVALVLIGFIVMAVLFGGCAPQTALGPVFAEFNQDVQDGLADCRQDPNTCRPTLEFVAIEVAKWNDFYNATEGGE